MRVCTHALRLLHTRSGPNAEKIREKEKRRSNPRLHYGSCRSPAGGEPQNHCSMQYRVSVRPSQNGCDVGSHTARTSPQACRFAAKLALIASAHRLLCKKKDSPPARFLYFALVSTSCPSRLYVFLKKCIHVRTVTRSFFILLSSPHIVYRSLG